MRILGALLAAFAFTVTAFLYKLIAGFERMGSSGPSDARMLWAFGGPFVILGIFLATTGGQAARGTKAAFLVATLACLALAMPFIVPALAQGEVPFLVALALVAGLTLTPIALADPPAP